MERQIREKKVITSLRARLLLILNYTLCLNAIGDVLDEDHLDEDHVRFYLFPYTIRCWPWCSDLDILLANV